MNIAIIGLANAGKTTVFGALTGRHVEITTYPSTSGDPQVGTVKVPDARLERLGEFFKPKKTTHAAVEYIDFIGLTKGDAKQNRKVFDLVKDADAIVQVVRLFADDAVAHPLERVNAARDIQTVELELIFGDLEFIEKRLARIEDEVKRGRKPDELERKVLVKCRDTLLKEIPLRTIAFTEEELQGMRHLQFLSTIPEVVVLNHSEEDIGNAGVKQLIEELTGPYHQIPLLPLCGKIEMEIAQLPAADRKIFLDDMGLYEPAAHKLIRACYDLLGLISFFTYAGDEVRAWTIKRGTPAQKAAGKVHSDMERGFIRAEVISFDELISAGDIHTARAKGLMRLEGKAYEIRDGDVINFRFNV